MQKIPLMQATAGMIIARDVFRGDSTSGMPVCGKGSELTASLIGRLEKMNIQTINVEGHPILLEGECSIDDLLFELDKRFSKSMQNSLNLILYDIYRDYLIKSMGGRSARQTD